MNASGLYGEKIEPVLSLVEYIVKEFELTLPDRPAKTSKDFKPWQACADQRAALIAFADKHLAEHKPTQVHYAESGYSLTLFDGPRVVLSKLEEDVQMRDEGIHITRPKSVAGQGGMRDTRGVPIVAAK